MKTSDLDFDDPAVIVEVVEHLFAAVGERSDPSHDDVAETVDIDVRFVGDGELPAPSRFHKKLLPSLVAAVPRAVPFWTGGGTPREFCLRIPVLSEGARKDVIDAARTAIEADGLWAIIADRSTG